MALTTDETKFLDTLTNKGLNDPKKLRYALDKFRERSTFEAKPSSFGEGVAEGATGGIKQMAKDYGEKVKESPIKEGFLAVPKLGLAVGKQILGAGKDVVTEAVEQPGKLWRGGKYIGKGLADIAKIVSEGGELTWGEEGVPTVGERTPEGKELGDRVRSDSAESIKKSANIVSTAGAVFNPALSGAAMGGMPYAERQEQGVQAGQNKSAELGQVAGEMLTGGLLGKATDFGVKKGTGKTPLELADATPKAVKNVTGGVKEVADVGVAKAGKAVEPVVDTGVQLATKVFEPENVLQNMNRMTQKEISDFAKINKGKTPSNWLIERDIISPPEETIQSLAARAEEAKALLDDSISKIEGTYTDSKLEVPIQELREQFTKTRPFGGEDVTAINSYAKKLESGEGLTLAETMNLKRIYERNVKVNYLKDNNATGIDRANQVDSMLRNFVRDEAEIAGMPNVARLSNEIQSSYTIANAIANRLAKAEANNPVSINDIILLGGSIADIPMGGSVGLIRAFLGMKGVKTWFVKAATKGDLKAMKELPGVPDEIINIKNAERRAFEFQKWASKNGLYQFAGETEPKLLPEGKSVEAPKASLESMSEVYREGNLEPSKLLPEEKAKKTVEVKGYSNVDDFKKAGSAESALLEEAKKYKTADEFVKAQGGISDSIVQANNKRVEIETRGKEIQELLKPYKQPNGLLDDTPEAKQLAIQAQNNLKELQAFNKSDLGKIVQAETRKLNITDRQKLLRGELQTKSQLKQIWEEANKKTK